MMCAFMTGVQTCALQIYLGATYFERTTTDQIIYDSCAPTWAVQLGFRPGANIYGWGYYQNVSRAEAQGIEVQAAAQLIDGLSIDGNYSWTLAEDRSTGSANLGNWLHRRPRHTANGSISYAWRFGLTTGVEIRWSRHSFDNSPKSTRLTYSTHRHLHAQ